MFLLNINLSSSWTFSFAEILSSTTAVLHHFHTIIWRIPNSFEYTRAHVHEIERKRKKKNTKRGKNKEKRGDMAIMKKRVQRPYSSKRRVRSLYSAGRLTMPGSSTRLETNRSDLPGRRPFFLSAFDPPIVPDVNAPRWIINRRTSWQGKGTRANGRAEREATEGETEKKNEVWASLKCHPCYRARKITFIWTSQRRTSDYLIFILQTYVLVFVCISFFFFWSTRIEKLIDDDVSNKNRNYW